MSFMIRAAIPSDREAVINLLPRLADFTVPENRHPDDLWAGDFKLLDAWFSEPHERLVVLTAVDTSNDTDEASSTERVLGSAAVSFREDLLSHEPSAHLEVLVLDKSAEGRGIGTALISAIEDVASDSGARSLSLHVFANNTRARALYEKVGFDGEILRYIKPI